MELQGKGPTNGPQHHSSHRHQPDILMTNQMEQNHHFESCDPLPLIRDQAKYDK